jgi:hypothetical protein
MFHILFTTSGPEDAHVPQTSNSGPPLPTHLAFVVQFAAETAVGRGWLVGRVEHVVSGSAAHFHTQNELLAFMGRASILQVTPRHGP